MLPASPGGDVLAAIAPKIELGTTQNGALATGEVAFFQIDPTVGGNLVAEVHAEGATTRLLLLDGQGNTLMQSDGQSLTNYNDQIELYVPPGLTFSRCKTWKGREPTT